MDVYLEWYITVSHPHIISLMQHEDDVRASHVGGTSDDVSSPPPPHGAYVTHCLQMITIIMDNLMDLANPYGEVYTLASQTTHLAPQTFASHNLLNKL